MGAAVECHKNTFKNKEWAAGSRRAARFYLNKTGAHGGAQAQGLGVADRTGKNVGEKAPSARKPGLTAGLYAIGARLRCALEGGWWPYARRQQEGRAA